LQAHAGVSQLGGVGVPEHVWGDPERFGIGPVLRIT
jgi:hypothetical protein